MQPALPWTRREAAVLSAILLVGFALRAAAAAAIPAPLESDYLGYWTMANNAYAGRGLADTDGQLTAFLNVGYPVFLWAVFSIAGPTLAAAKSANVALGMATILLTYLASRNLFKSARVAALAALLVATYLEAVVYTAYTAKENLMNVLVMAQLALVAAPRFRVLNAILFGVAVGWMAMVGNAGLALLPGLGFQIAVAAKGGAIRHLAIAAMVAFLTTCPLLLRNHAVFGAYTLNNNGGFNLYIGNNPNAQPEFESIADTPIGGDYGELRSRLGERGSDVLLRDLAIQYIAQHPAATAELALRKALVFWTPPVHGGKYEEGAATKLVRFAWLVQYCLIGGLFVIGTLWHRRYRQAAATLWLMVAGYTAVHMIFYVVFRYRLPIMPVLCVGAGAVIDAVPLLLRPGRSASHLPGAAVKAP